MSLRARREMRRGSLVVVLACPELGVSMDGVNDPRRGDDLA